LVELEKCFEKQAENFFNGRQTAYYQLAVQSCTKLIHFWKMSFQKTNFFGRFRRHGWGCGAGG